MDDFFLKLSSEELSIAKKRIWNSLKTNLPERGSHKIVLSSLKKAQAGVESSSLLRVQAKERLIDLLPDRVKRPSYFSRIRVTLFEKRVWSVATLSIFFTVIFAPLFQFTPLAAARVSNVLEVVQGTATVIRNSEIIIVDEAIVIFEGDRVIMDNGSVAHIQFVDDSRMTLGSDADVLLTELFVNPNNSARTEIVVDQFAGQVWSQVLNLVTNDSFFALRFPEGEVVARQRSSFDVNISEEGTEIQVARNLVDVIVITDDLIHEGIIGQGAYLFVGEEFETGELSEEQLESVWWDFNLSYGQYYAGELDEKYQKAANNLLILPGSLFYPLKVLQESVQDFVVLTDGAKQKLAMHRVETRLIEAKALIAVGEDEKAEDVMDAYDDAIDKVAGLIEGDELLVHFEEAQKELMILDGENRVLIEDHVDDGKDNVDMNIEDKMLTASQKLMRVSTLIAAGDYETAYQYLMAYREKSIQTLLELESVPLEDREVLIAEILPAKLQDLQMLRIIAAMPELAGVVDIDSQMLQEMSMMILTLRERELDHLSTFVQTDRDNDVQFDLYTRLKDSVDLTAEVDAQFEALEEQFEQVATETIVVEFTTTDVLKDPRLSDSHSDESEEETGSGSDSAEDPESHDDL